MIAEPLHPTEQYIEGRISFHQSGAEYFARHGQAQLAQWARTQVARWSEKLDAMKRVGRESGDGE
jgi:hypothetical protein